MNLFPGTSIYHILYFTFCPFLTLHRAAGTNKRSESDCTVPAWWCQKRQWQPEHRGSTWEPGCGIAPVPPCPRSQTWLWCRPDTPTEPGRPLHIQTYGLRSYTHTHTRPPAQAKAKLLTSYGCFLELIKLAFDEPQHQAGFAYSHVTQQHQFELANLGLRQGAVGADSTPSGVHSSLYWRRLGVLGLLPLWSEALLLTSKLNMVGLSLAWQNQAGSG